ncbi:hypothetical protein F4677DRAFT_308392 [Hypoxylon crocopeplum]|nr:hypothetical protein F4677DRAFT_308392 [Hypoxylon crocopeplum]
MAPVMLLDWTFCFVEPASWLLTIARLPSSSLPQRHAILAKILFSAAATKSTQMHAKPLGSDDADKCDQLCLSRDVVKLEVKIVMAK